jgi:uncharacterized YigZ family protein
MEDIIAGIQGTHQVEYIIQKSRFIATIQEIHSEDNAHIFIDTVKKQFWDASHNCWAYQLGPIGQHQKSSDDGEPSGTAGRPMLEVLKKSHITNTAVVVTRYFGGIKLGTGGLIRAYSHAVTLGVASAVIADYIPHQQAVASFDYTFIQVVDQLTMDQRVLITDRAFSDIVNYSLLIPLETVPNFALNFANSTQGTASLTLQQPTILPILRHK